MSKICKCKVKEAEDGDVVEPGKIIIAKGGLHMMVNKSLAGKYTIALKNGPLVSFQRPAVDVLFQSVAKAAGSDVVGVILTGMGSDGTAGAKVIKDCGGKIIGQDEATCVVYGMPKSAYDAGVVDIQMPLNSIPRKVLDVCHV